MRKLSLAIASLSALLFACDPTTDDVALTLSVQATDGSAVTTLEIPAEGKTASVSVLSNTTWVAECKADWIKIDPSTSINTDNSAKAVVVNITVDKNTTTEVRSAQLTISIAEQKVELTVNQAAGSASDWEVYTAAAVYYGDYYENGTANWYIDLWDEAYATSDVDNETGIVCALDCVAAASATFDKGLPTGTFTFSEEATAGTFVLSGIITYQDGEVIKSSTSPFTKGTVTIAKTGEQYTITVDAESANGKHSLTYSGTVEIFDKSSIGGLTGDVELVPTAISAYYDSTSYALPCWETYIYDDTYFIAMFINTDQKAFSEGIPSGTYNVNDTFGAGCIDVGVVEDGEAWGSWMWTMADKSPAAMLASGTVDIVNKGDDNYTFTINLVEGNGYKITGSYDGAVVVEDTDAAVANTKVRATSAAKKLQHRNASAAVAKQPARKALFCK